MRVFLASVCPWSFTGVWVTARNLLNKAIVGWSPIVLLFLSPSASVPIFWWLHWAHQLQLVSPSLSCSIVCLGFFFQFTSKVSVRISFFAFFFQFYPVVSRNDKFHYSAGSWFFLLTITIGLVIWPRSDDPFVSQNHKEFWAYYYYYYYFLAGF